MASKVNDDEGHIVPNGCDEDATMSDNDRLRAIICFCIELITDVWLC